MNIPKYLCGLAKATLMKAIQRQVYTLCKYINWWYKYGM